MKMSMRSNIEQKTIHIAFKEFVQYKMSNNISPATIKDYEMIFSIFENFLGANSLCSSITEDTIQEYINYLKTKPKKTGKNDDEVEYLSSVTIATYIRHLRAVLNFFMKRGYTKNFVIQLPKADKEVKEAYSDSELKALLKKPDLKICSFSEYRNWVMTNYFLSTANRLSTVQNLRIKDLNFEDNEICLRHVKNRKAYVIPMQKDLKKILVEYLTYRKGEPDDYLFCNENDDKKPLTKNGIKTAMARYNNNRGVMKTSVHIYRNTFAKYWILSGGDIVRLQKILSHKKLNMVLEYVDMYGNDLQKGFDDFNPLSAFSKGEHIVIKR